MENHLKRLESLCSICTKRLGRVSRPTATQHLLRKLTTLYIEECFGSKIRDNPATYPPQFCNPCYLTMRRIKKARQDGSVYRTSLTLHPWTVHIDGDCMTCDMVEKRKTGGRAETLKDALVQSTQDVLLALGSGAPLVSPPTES